MGDNFNGGGGGGGGGNGGIYLHDITNLQV